jgi:hypothetical protein
MMRERDLRGEKELRGARSLMCWRMVAREAGWKMWASLRRVIRRVLEGGEGVERGGIELRSRERGVCVRRPEREEGDEEVETGGELERSTRWCCGVV